MHVREENMQMEVRTLGRTGPTKVGYVWLMILAATLILFGGTAHGQQNPPGQQDSSGQQDLSEIAKELTNPVSNVWSMFTEFDLFFSDGNINKTGRSKVGGRMIFQPVLPIPLYGEVPHQWKLITRPTIPEVFSQHIPQDFNDFTNLGGLGDTHRPHLST